MSFKVFINQKQVGYVTARTEAMALKKATKLYGEGVVLKLMQFDFTNIQL